MIWWAEDFPVSVFCSRFSFSVSEFVLPPHGARNTWGAKYLALFSWEPFAISVRARLKGERIWRAHSGWERYPLYFHTWRCSIKYIFFGFWKGPYLEESRPFLVQLRALTMEMKRWTTRWKTKRWLWDSTLAALVTLILILQAASVRAGKRLFVTSKHCHRAKSGASRSDHRLVYSP